MGRGRVLGVVLAALALSGCVTYTDSKVARITPKPGESEVIVTTKLQGRCFHVFGFAKCNVKLTVEGQ